MATIKIQVISTFVENVPTANGGYDKLTVTYKDPASGKVDAKSNIMSFTVPQVFERLKEAQKDEIFDVTLEKKLAKDGKSYWTWTEVNRFDGVVEQVAKPTTAAPASSAAPKNTYAENNDINRQRLAFDKEKQALIIRQSCLSAAVAFHKDQGKKPTVDDVLSLSKTFEDYVWNKGIAGLVGDSLDDVPL